MSQQPELWLIKLLNEPYCSLRHADLRLQFKVAWFPTPLRRGLEIGTNSVYHISLTSPISGLPLRPGDLIASVFSLLETLSFQILQEHRSSNNNISGFLNWLQREVSRVQNLLQHGLLSKFTVLESQRVGIS